MMKGTLCLLCQQGKVFFVPHFLSPDSRSLQACKVIAYDIHVIIIKMADRFFSKEGLQTSVNRDAEANRIVSRINGVQNALFREDSDPKKEMPVPAVLYASVFALVAEMTQEASGRGDTAWPNDMEQVLRFVVPIYARDQKEALDMLLFALRSSWRQSEATNGRKVTVGQRIDSLVRGVRGAVGRFENWAKRQ